MARDPFADLDPLIKSVYAYVAYRIGHGPDAEDVTSATFERAFRYRESYDRSRGKPVSWLIGIARRCIEDARLSRQRDPADPYGITPEDDGAVVLQGASSQDVQTDDFAEEADGRMTIREALLHLDAHDRDLIALRYGADLKVRQIAELLGERTNTVEVALHRALERLRAVVEAERPRRRVAAAQWSALLAGEGLAGRRNPP